MEGDNYISIGIFAYNGEKFIADAIVSVLNQSYENFELIISDDCSTDKTEEICRKFAEKDKRIKYYRQNPNIGGFKNANFVLQQAGGKYFAWLAQDDILKPNYLKILSEYLDNNPRCILVSGDVEMVDIQGNHISHEKLYKIREDIPWRKRRLEFFKYPLARTFLCIYGLMRTGPIKKVFPKVPYNKKTTKGSEMIMLDRFSLLGEICSLPYTLRKQRRHNESMYNSELIKNNSSPIKYCLKGILHTYWIRYDQIKVLLSANLNSKEKIKYIFLIYREYTESFIRRILNLITRKFIEFQQQSTN